MNWGQHVWLWAAVIGLCGFNLAQSRIIGGYHGGVGVFVAA